jgi:hypothetical protein
MYRSCQVSAYNRAKQQLPPVSAPPPMISWKLHPPSPAEASLQVHGSSRVGEATGARQLGMLTCLGYLKDLELNQCAPHPA